MVVVSLVKDSSQSREKALLEWVELLIILLLTLKGKTSSCNNHSYLPQNHPSNLLHLQNQRNQAILRTKQNNLPFYHDIQSRIKYDKMPNSHPPHHNRTRHPSPSLNWTNNGTKRTGPRQLCCIAGRRPHPKMSWEMRTVSSSPCSLGWWPRDQEAQRQTIWLHTL